MTRANPPRDRVFLLIADVDVVKADGAETRTFIQHTGQTYLATVNAKTQSGKKLNLRADGIAFGLHR